VSTWSGILLASVLASSSSASAPAVPPAISPGDTAVEQVEVDPTAELGDYALPIPLSRREPTLRAGGLEIDLHYGLVGSGPTQLTNDLRFAPLDWLELRTSFAPYPASLMARFKLGEHNAALGALVLDGGLANFDAGIRVFPVEGEPPVGLRVHTELGLAYSRAIAGRFAVHTALRWRHRISALSDDEQSALLGSAQLSYDVMSNLGVSIGLGYARIVSGEVRELAIQFTEPGRPGMSTFLIRQDEYTESLTLPLSLTYGMVDSFDVDVFATPRFYPQFDVVFGAGVRLRLIDVGASLSSLFGASGTGSKTVLIDQET
jgi:hypothetical protein